MLTIDDLFDLNKTGLKYHVVRCIQQENGLGFVIKMDHEMKPEKKTEDNVTQLHTITGGKDGGGNWLASLPKGSVFLCKEKAKEKEGCLLTQFHILSKFTKAALLMSNYPGPDFRVFVEMNSFSQQNTLVEVMQTGEDDDGNSHSDDAGLDQS